jgi:hypothetical protein
MAKKYIALCGLDCSTCPAYIATKTKDNDLREKTAREWNERYNEDGRDPIKPEDINCEGCISNGVVYLHCKECAVRKCGLSRGLKNCKQCKNYRCEQLKDLQDHLF